MSPAPPAATATAGPPGTSPPARLPFPRATNINFVMFWVVAFVTLMNLPRLAWVIVVIATGPGGGEVGVPGVTRFVALSCVLLAATARVLPMRAMGRPGFFFLATVALHSIIGTAVSMYHDVEFVPSWTQQYSLLGILIVAVVASGVVETASRIGVDWLLKGVLAILVLTSVSVFATPALELIDIVWAIDSGRAEGFLSGPNTGAYFACLTIALASALIAWRGVSVLTIVAICIAVPAIVVTASRTGMIMLVAVVIMHICYGAKKFGAAIVPVSVIALAVFAAIGWLAVTDPDLPFTVDVGRLTSVEDVDRLSLMQHGLSIIMESPIVGHGIDTFLSMRDSPTACRTHVQMVACGVHSTYLLFLGEAGILPFVSFLMFFVVIFAKCSWPPDSLPKTVVIGWMLCLALYSLSDHTVPTDLGIYFIVGASCGLLSYGGAAAHARDLYEDKSLE